MTNMTVRSKILLFISFLLVIAIPVSAATIKAGEEYSLVDDEVVEGDLYVAGGDISISGVVEGDLITTGGSILVNGAVQNDTLIFGGAIDVVSTTGDDLRLVGGQIRLGDSVAGDAIVAGGFVRVLSSASVGEDFVVAAGRVVIDGDVLGNLKVYAGEVLINGTIGGDAELFVSEKFSIGENARIGGDLTYSAPREVVLHSEEIVGGVTTFNETRITRDVKTFVGALFGLLFITKILALLTAGLLGVLVFRKFSQVLVNRAVHNLGMDTLRGVVVLVVVPILLIFFFVTTIGFVLGILGSLAFIFVIVLSKVYAGIIFGALLSKWVHKEVILNWQWTIVGITVLQIIGLIPIFGWLVIFVAFLLAFGSLAHIIYSHLWLNRA